MASGKAKLPCQASFLTKKRCKRRKLLPKKGSKITEKGNERYEDEFPDRETSYPIGTVFLTKYLIFICKNILINTNTHDKYR